MSQKKKANNNKCAHPPLKNDVSWIKQVMNRIRTMSLRKNYAYICKDLYPNQKLLMLRGRPMGLLLI